MIEKKNESSMRTRVGRQQQPSEGRSRADMTHKVKMKR